MHGICKLSFRCRLDWDELEPLPKPGRRYCGECRQEVVLVHTDEDARAAARDHRCVAFQAGDKMMRGRTELVDIEIYDSGRFDLERFVAAQEGVFPAAMRELRAGTKQGHWMWFVLPQLRGLGTSAPSRQYGIASLDEAKAYLAHPVLGHRFLECVEVILGHQTASIESILGETDAMKYRSSLTLFETAGGPPLIGRSLEAFYSGTRCERTLALLAQQAAKDG